MRWLKSRKVLFFNLFSLTIILTIFLTLVISGKISLVNDLSAARRRRARYRIPNRTALYVQNTFRHIAKKVRPAVVTIQTFASSLQRVRPDLPDFYKRFFGYRITPNTPLNIGSGFIIDHRGYIITNYHVIKKSTKILVRLFDGRTFKAKIIGFDSGSDIAVLKISGRRLPEVRMGNSKKIRVGDWSIAIGNPSGFVGTFTVGVISGKNRIENTTGIYQKYIQTDAAINPGNSGGPLIDISGRVIGVNSWIHSRVGQSSGINFAIPINTVIQYLTRIIKHGSIERNGYIGISIRDARQFTTQYKGGYVTGVTPGGPADKGGLKKGDILIALNDVPIENIFKYMKLVINSRVGEKVVFTIVRKRKIIKRAVKVGREPLKKAFLNIIVEELNPQHRKRLGLLANDEGVVIKKMARYSPMRKAGFKPGDVIFMFDNHIIKSVFDYKLLSILLKKRGWVFVKVKRGNKIKVAYVLLADDN